MLLQLESDKLKWSELDWLAQRLMWNFLQTEEVTFDRMYIGVGHVYLMCRTNEAGTYECKVVAFSDIAEEFKDELASEEIERGDELEHLKRLLALNIAQYPPYKLECFFTDAVEYINARAQRAEESIQREAKQLGGLLKMLNGKPQ